MEKSPGHSQILIKRLTEIVLANLSDDKFGVSELAKESGISRSWLNHKISSATGKTSNQFIHEIRLNKALEILQNEDVTATEAAYRTGFSSPAYFNTCFHEFFGYPPGKVIKTSLTDKVENPVTQNISKWGYKKVTKKVSILKISVILLLAFSIVLLVIQIFGSTSKKKTIHDLRISDEKITVAVMPFLNMTNDKKWDIWQIALQTNLIYRLTNLNEIKVRQTETINGLLQSKGFTDFASITPSVASKFARTLDANVFIYGSINEAGNKIRVNAAVINSRTKEALKSFQADGISGKIIDVIDSVSDMIKNSLLISQLDKKYSPGYNTNITNSPEAFGCFIQGETAFSKHDFTTAIDWYQQALAIDSNLIQAISGVTRAYINLQYYGKPSLEQAKAWCLRYYRKKKMMTPADKIWADWLYAGCFQTPYERIKYLRQYLDLDDQNSRTYFNIGDAYLELMQFDEAITAFLKAFEICHKRDEPPPIMYYQELGHSYRGAGRYKEEKRLYKKAKKDYPDAPDLIQHYAWVSFREGDTTQGNKYIKEFTSIRKEQSWSDADILSEIGWIYEVAGMLDKEEDCLRQAILLDPENPYRIINLAYLLIDVNKDGNINEGLALAEKALGIDPNSVSGLHYKGWGLYKQGKYREALDLLQKSWDLRIQKAIYSHKAFLHLEAARKAVEEQTSNNNTLR